MGRRLGVGLRRIPHETYAAHGGIDGPQQFEQLPHGRQASQPSHIGWVVEVVLTADIDPRAVGVGSNAEDVHGRVRPRPVRIRDGLQGGGRGRDDHVEVRARDLRRDGVGNGKVALSVVARHFEAAPILETPRRESCEDTADAFIHRLHRGELHHRHSPRRASIAFIGSRTVTPGVEVR